MEGAMDFQSLSRRELQALCKKNKIPANMTNVAMADALQSLQHVDGIEEVIKSAESETHQSPEKMIGGSTSMDVPRTVCRTSTRRKPVKDEPESAQPLTRTRGGTRRRITEDVSQTPAQASSRRRAPIVAASARQKTESLMCSTRRSVRLAEKQMAELSLNEKGKIQPIKIEDFSKEMPECLDDVQENKSLSGADTQEVSEEGSGWTNDSEVVSDPNPKEVLDAKCEVSSVLSGEKGRVVEEGAYEEIMGVDLHTQPGVGSKATDESDVSCGEKLENVLKQNLDNEMKHVEKTGCDDFPVTMVLCDVEKSNGDLGLENETKLSVDHSMSLNDSSIVTNCGDLSSDCVGLVALSEESENSGCFMESKEEAVNGIGAIDSVEVAPWSDDNDGIRQVRMEKAIMPMTDECPPPFDGTLAPREILPVSNAIVTDEIISSTLVADPMPGNEIGEEEFDLATIEHPPTLENSPTSVKKMSPHHLVSNEELKGEIPFTNWAVDPLMGRIPRPTQLTPRKSSSKKQTKTTLPRMNNLLDHNKENVDITDGKMELMKEKVKKIKDISKDSTSTPLDEKSLRKLTKMLKSKLQLTSNMKNNDIQNAVQQQQELGKARPALQALPENQD